MTSQIDCAGAQQPLAEDTSAASEAQMDSYTEAILAFLEGHKAVAAVRYQPREPCVHSDLVRWEARNQPFKYALTNSLSHFSPLTLLSPTLTLYPPATKPYLSHLVAPLTGGTSPARCAQTAGGFAGVHACVQRLQPVLGRAYPQSYRARRQYVPQRRG
jgi:hypothetical protein